MRFCKRYGWLLLLIPIIAVAGFVAWGSIVPAAQAEAQTAMQSGNGVQVAAEPWLVFAPDNGQPSAGLVFYPGGRVPAEAYAPNARAIAAQGYLVVIVPMPLHLAVFDANAAAEVMATYPQMNAWAVGGHSLGGSMAARFADLNPEQVQGLALWASYPAGSNALSDQNLEVTSIYGTLDGLATPDKIAASRPLLPPNTVWVEIPGGNHAQFGWYGAQDGDNPAEISHAEQAAITVQATLDLLARMSVQTAAR